jgi:hypothetical protein
MTALCGVRAVAFSGPRRGALQQEGQLQPDPADRPHRQDDEPVEGGRRPRSSSTPDTGGCTTRHREGTRCLTFDCSILPFFRSA